MKEKQPEGPYHLAGYSYGACIAFEMALQLQDRQTDKPGMVASLTLIDSSVHYMQAYRRMYRLVFGVVGDISHDPLFESELLIAMITRMTVIDFAQTRENLMACSDWEARVEHGWTMVKESGLFGENVKLWTWICNNLRARFLAADK